jgi:phage gp36-like protein
MYTAIQTMIDLFGASEMAQLGDPDLSSSVTGELLQLTVDGGDRSAYTQAEQDAADAAVVRINNSISTAEKRINSYISPRYSLPLSQTLIDESSLPQAAADIARYLLMDDKATDEADTRFRHSIAWLRDVQANKASLGEQDTGVATPQGRINTAQGCSQFEWEAY